METLEDEMRGIDHIYANFSLNRDSTDDFYVEKTGTYTVGR
jgi:hypothetical protein